jgi:uncharacterized protein
MTAGSPDPGVVPPELMETIDPAGCARLLAAVDVGRLAVVVDGNPHIVVLNYLLHDGALLFRTRADAAVAEITADGAVVDAEFEVDSAFPVAQSGWSVIATGTLRRETDARRMTAARGAVRAWAQGERDTVLRLDVTELTGRRVGSL